MNSLTLYVNEITGGKVFKEEGIVFANSLFVKMLIDGEEVDELDSFNGSVVYFDELEQSVKKSGVYLIFTCICGVAEDAGWEGVKVEIKEDTVCWEFELGEKLYHYTFDIQEYESEIESVKRHIRQSTLTVQPESVVFPPLFPVRT